MTKTKELHTNFGTFATQNFKLSNKIISQIIFPYANQSIRYLHNAT